MGKGCENQGAEKVYKWSEIKTHDSRKDLWIVIDGNVYDITNFQFKHPGGSKIMKFFGAQDATEAFIAFHKDKTKSQKYMKTYFVGKLDETTEDPVLKESLARRNSMKNDLENLRQLAIKMGLFEPSVFFYIITGVHIVLLNILGYFILKQFGGGWIPYILALMCHVSVQVQSNWTGHDYGHLSVFKSSKMNQLVQAFFMGFIKGISPRWWNFTHNSHHAKPNVIDKDPDTRIEPLFVLGEDQPKRAAKMKAQKKGPPTLPYNHQHKYFPLVAAVIFPLYFHIINIRYILNRRKYYDFAILSVMYYIFFTIVGNVLGGWGALRYYMLVRAFESIWFAFVSQSNHIVMDVFYDNDDDTWLSGQIRSTCNINKSYFNDWFTGHLNFQIEHHLFPQMPRHNLYKIAPLVKSLCKKHNVNYVVKPLGTAFIDIFFSLKKSGQMWKEVFEEIRYDPAEDDVRSN